MHIAIGADHAGVHLKAELVAFLAEGGHEVDDLGTTGDESVDYPDFGAAVGRAVAGGAAEVGVCVCGTGIGISIAANKVPGVRATVAHDAFSVERSILSNDCQVLTLGQRVIGLELTRRLVREWITYRFDPASASAAKVDVISAYESR